MWKTAQKESKRKLDARGLPGILVGYDMHAGERWSKRYWVIPMDHTKYIDVRRGTLGEGKTPYALARENVIPRLPSDSMGVAGRERFPYERKIRYGEL